MISNHQMIQEPVWETKVSIEAKLFERNELMQQVQCLLRKGYEQG
jgi:hypothetical protein